MMGGVYPARLSSLLSASGVLAAVWWWAVVGGGCWALGRGAGAPLGGNKADIRYKRQAK